MHAGVRERVHLVHYQRRFVRVAHGEAPWSVLIPLPASEKCQQEKRKTVNGEDILFAMTSLGFENYAEALKIYLSKYRDVSCGGLARGALPMDPTGTFWLTSEQTQSARGENRPGSQGFGSAPVGGQTGAANAASSTAFPGGAESTNTILGQQSDGAEHDSANYGGLYGGQVSSGHNGAAGGDAY